MNYIYFLIAIYSHSYYPPVKVAEFGTKEACEQAIVDIAKVQYQNYKLICVRQ